MWPDIFHNITWIIGIGDSSPIWLNKKPDLKLALADNESAFDKRMPLNSLSRPTD